VSKPWEEISGEITSQITVAWIQSIGSSNLTIPEKAKFLSEDVVADFYSHIYKTVKQSLTTPC